MNDSQHRALPFITVDSRGRFSVNEQAAAFLDRLDAPLAIVAVAGKYRTGKSLLLNRVMLQVGDGAGFGVGETVQACTKGLWLHTKVLGVPQEDGSIQNVLIVDTEGLGAFNATETHDSRVFALALLVSSFFIYNSVGTIDEQAISTLSLVANISKHVRARSDAAVKAGDSGDMETDDNDDGEKLQQQEALQDARELGRHFPDFLWLVRDFSLQLRDEHGEALSENEYLEQALRDQSADNVDSDAARQSIAEKNRLRALLRAYFPRRSCATLVRPCANESDLQRLDSMPDSALRAEFVQAARRLQSRVLRAAPAKSIGDSGKTLSGRGLLRLCRSYVDAMNSGAAPVIRDSWALLSEVQFRDAVESADDCYRQVVEQSGDGPFAPLALRRLLDLAEERALQHFAREVPEPDGVLFEQFERRLRDKLRVLAADAIATNERTLHALTRSLLDQYYHRETVERLIERGDLSEFVLDCMIKSREAFFERLIGDDNVWPDEAVVYSIRSIWEVAAADHTEQTLRRFGERCTALNAELAELRESAQRIEQLRQQIESGEQALRAEKERSVEALAERAAEVRALGEQIAELQSQCADLSSEAASRSALSEEEWAQKERALREQTHAEVSEASARAERAEREAASLRAQSESIGDSFRERIAQLQLETEQSLRSMHDAHAQQVEALQTRCEQSESERDALQRDVRLLRERAVDSEQQLAEERKRFETSLQSLNDRWRAESAKHHDERLTLTRSIKEAEATAALRQQQLEALRERMAEEKPNVEAERARAALERVDEEAKRLRSETFESRRALDDQRAKVRSLEQQLSEQERKFEMAKMQLRLDFEVQLAKERASLHSGSASTGSIKRSMGSVLGGGASSSSTPTHYYGAARNNETTMTTGATKSGFGDDSLPSAKRRREESAGSLTPLSK